MKSNTLAFTFIGACAALISGAYYLVLTTDDLAKMGITGDEFYIRLIAASPLIMFFCCVVLVSFIGIGHIITRIKEDRQLRKAQADARKANKK